jgi:two-component system cell cycle response regulator
MAEQDDRRRALRSMKTFGGSTPPPPVKATRAVLTLQSGAEAGRVVALAPEKPTTLGRADECTIAFDEARLSRVHARITYIGGMWMLSDEGSTNGTFVNGARIEQSSALEDGARLGLGGTVSLRFTLVTEEEEQALSRVFDAAMRDGLTGVYNRKALDERLASEWAFAVRHVASLAIVMLDIDHFKATNDHHGHVVGDAVLKEVASRLVRGIRVEDVVGRYGGEEFVVIARDTSLARAAQLAERLRGTIAAEPIRVGALAIPVTASFGVASIACCGEEKKDARRLLEIADARLYAAKRAGRNCVVATS